MFFFFHPLTHTTQAPHSSVRPSPFHYPTPTVVNIHLHYMRIPSLMECAQSSCSINDGTRASSFVNSISGKKIVTFFVPSGLFVSTAHPAGLYIEFHFLVYHCHWIVTYTGGAITVSSSCDTEKLYMKALNMCLVKQENKVTVVKISECRISKGSLRWF